MFSKCEFWLQSVAFLGHIVYNEGIRVDSHKIEVVKQWPRHTSAADIKNFLGLAGYYRSFLERFSSIALPLTRLTRRWSSFNSQMIVRKASQYWKLDWLQLMSWLYQRVQMVMWSIAMHPELALVVCWCKEIRLYLMPLEILRCMRRTIQLMTSSLQQRCLHSWYGDTTCMVFM